MRRLEQLDDNIGATTIDLEPHERAALDGVSAMRPEYPGWMLERMRDGRRRQSAARQA